MLQQHEIGISFTFFGYKKHLLTLLEKINVKDYTWYITNSEIYGCVHSNEIKAHLPPKIYSGDSFYREIGSGDYHIIHARIFAAKPEAALNPDRILTHRDFMDSSAELAILCADSMADVYIKNVQTPAQMADSASKLTDEPVTIITPENDARTRWLI